MIWHNTAKIESKNYICGHCGNDITSNKGYYIRHDYETSSANGHGYIYICHKCNKPTFFQYDSQVPNSLYGKCFNEDIFEDKMIYELYEEARHCMIVNAYTSVGMCCRKLLMHIAVDCGADVGEKFAFYVNYLDKQNYIPVKCKDWVDIIRDKGNEANHEIVILEEKDAKQLINFIEIIISVIYEMPYQAKIYLDKEK